MALAIFDLDNTLLNGDSDHAWGEFLVEQSIVDIKVYQQNNEKFYQQYKDGCLDINEYLNFCLSPLRQYEDQQLEKLHQQFMAEKIDSIILPKGLELLERHRQKGDFLLIITATNEFVTGPIAKKLNVDDLIASQVERKDGRYTGKPTGEPSFAEGKINRLNNWLKGKNLPLEGAYFYSDSHNDLPLLEIIDNPVVVDGDETLIAKAKQNNWPSISLRS